MNGDSFNFGNPELGWALLPALLLVVWAAVQLARWTRRLSRLGRGPVLLQLADSVSPQRQATRIALWGLAILLLVGAAARPRYGVRETEVSNAGIDVALLVDASKSMLVKDIVPNRLQGTVIEISALLGKLAGGRVALVPFAGIPFVQCPLTSDHDVIRTYLQDLRPEDLPVGGTNIGRAISLATELLTGEREHAEAELRDNLMPQFKGSKNKAIVLFSDGEDHEGAALEAARKAAEKGIKIYTVGVGSAFGDPVPVLGPDGTVTGVLKDEQGNPVFSKLNLDLMKQIAEATGGKSLHYGNQSVVPELFQALDALEKAEYQAQFKLLGEDRYQWLLGPALLLLLLELMLAPRRRVAAAKVAVKVAGATLLLVSVALLSMPGPASAAWLERENPDISNGRKNIEQKKYGDALQSFKQAQATRPEHAMIWFDIGIVQGWMGDHAEAVTSLSRALGAVALRDAKLEADIHYALGTTQLQWARSLEAAKAADKPADPKAGDPAAKPEPAPQDPAQAQQAAGADPSAAAPSDDPVQHYKLAVQSLEQALLADPTRSDIRRNLELARLGAFPPCSSRDKSEEPNDTLEQARPMTMPEGQREAKLDLRICPGDRDLFALQVQPGDRVSATVQTKADPVAQGAVEDSTAPGGKPQLGLSILSGAGVPLVAGTGPDDKPVEAVDVGAVAQADKLLVDVRDRGDIESPYDLTVKVLPACPRTEDHGEPNDFPGQARAISVGQPLQGRLCPANPDYYKVSLLPGQGLKIAAKTKVDIGSQQVSLDVVDGLDHVLAHGVSGKDGMAARLATQPGGDVLVRLVGGADTEADYDLQIEVLPPCQERDDPFEDNDQAIEANPLTDEMISKPLEGLQLCPGDDDWYAADLKAGESLFLDLSASVEGMPDAADLAGQLTVEVYDEKGTLWGEAVGTAVSQGGSVMRTVAVLAPPPGRYRVRVTGGGVESPHFPPGGIQNLPAAPIGPPAQPQQQPGTLPPGPAMPGAPQLPGGMPPMGMPQIPGTAGLPRPAGAPPLVGVPGQPSGPGQGVAGQPGQPPIPQPIPHIQLPPGTPVPGVDRQRALLDLPYTLRLRILPPCPQGNDESEPNDSAKDAKPIEVGNEKLLRICKGDTDWLQLTQKAGQNLQITARYDRSHGGLDLALYDESGVKELARAQTATAEDGKKRDDKTDTPAARKGRTAVQAMAVQAGKGDRVVKIRASAQPNVENFYVLRIEEPPPPSDKDKQDQKDKDDKKDQEDKDKQDQQKQDQKDQPKPEDQKKEDQERLKRQMERNDHNPTNLEAQEALRRSPMKNSQPDKDW